MIRALIPLLFLCFFAQAEVLPNAAGGVGVEGSGFIVKLTEAQWRALVDEKISEKDGISLFLSNSSKWSVLILYKNERYFLLHNYLQFAERFSIDSRGDPKNLLLVGHEDNRRIKFLIDTVKAEFLYVGF